MKRIYFLDNIRVFAMFAVLTVHALVFYSHHVFIDYIPHFQTDYFSIDYILYFLHYINMPIFFVLGGYFAKHIMQSHGIAYFLNERFVKLGIPFILGILIIAPIHFMIFVDQFIGHTEWVHQPNKIITLIIQVFLNPEYFWFIYYLLCYSFIAILCCQTKVFDFTMRFLFNRRHYIATSILLLALFISLGTTIPIALPLSIKIMPQPFLVYGFFFYYGWMSRSEVFIFENNKRFCWLFMWMSLLALGGIILLWPYSNQQLIYNMIICIDAVSLFLLCNSFFGLFYRYCDFSNKTLKFLSVTSYWTYLINFPIFAVLSLLFFPLPIPLFFKIILELICILLISFASYTFMIERTFLLQIYQGKYRITFRQKKLVIT